LAQLQLAQGAAAHLAHLPTTSVGEQLLLEVARLTVTANEVAQGSAAALDGTGENALDLCGQASIAGARDAASLAARVDAGGEQRLGGVDIADAHHHRVVHYEGLDRHAA